MNVHYKPRLSFVTFHYERKEPIFETNKEKKMHSIKETFLRTKQSHPGKITKQTKLMGR